MKENNRAPLWLSGQRKIREGHYQRGAYVYVRQSTIKQVLHNQESQRYQRQLVQLAEALGWQPEMIELIDTDMAQSGQYSHHRQGFQTLVTQVSLGEVGIILSYDVSRLARNNSDWYQLLDLAAVFDTLIADSDGIYHPGLYNDRLLLGLKGTMSEAELHLIKQRFEAGRLSQVKRGVYRQRLPTGLVRLSDGTVTYDPNERVQQALKLVFTKFEELGAAHQVARYCWAHEIQLPRRQTSGLNKGEIEWKKASVTAIREILCNPAYAGAFVYGRTKADPNRRQSKTGKSLRLKQPMADWNHVQQNVYPAYISWEQYLANRARLQQNAPPFAGRKSPPCGPVREGKALLQGLAVCGHCGHQVYVIYPDRLRPTYICYGLKDIGAPSCFTTRGNTIDTAVENAFFQALAPANLNTLTAVIAKQQAERDLVRKQWQKRLEQAQYEAHFAARQYNAVDPDNRLVAAELERGWEGKLRYLQKLEASYAQTEQATEVPPLPPELRDQFQHVSMALPQLWPRCTNQQKKELLRCLMERVILFRPSPEQMVIRIIWISGYVSELSVGLPLHRSHQLPHYQEMLAQLETLWRAGYSDQKIADELTAKGFRSARNLYITVEVVRKMRYSQGWHRTLSTYREVLKQSGWLTIRGLAELLGVDRSWVYTRVGNGRIPAHLIRRDPQSNVFWIRHDADVITDLQAELSPQYKV